MDEFNVEVNFDQVASEIVMVKGEKGDIGDTGATGPANTLVIGTVAKGDNADATITGTSPNQTLNLVLPKGDKGDTGAQGEAGKSIKSFTVQYYLSTSETEIADGNWQNSFPVKTENTFIWRRNVITYTDNSTATSDPVLDGQANKLYSIYATSAGSIPLDQRWPVGSVYFQVGTTASPASVLGGTWAALAEDLRMILAGPASSGNNCTGGSLTTGSTTLTAAQSGLPSHQHQYYNLTSWVGTYAGSTGSNIQVRGKEDVSLNTGATGGNSASQGHVHSMDWNPYITVTAWKRTA